MGILRFWKSIRSAGTAPVISYRTSFLMPDGVSLLGIANDTVFDIYKYSTSSMTDPSTWASATSFPGENVCYNNQLQFAGKFLSDDSFLGIAHSKRIADDVPVLSIYSADSNGANWSQLAVIEIGDAEVNTLNKFGVIIERPNGYYFFRNYTDRTTTPYMEYQQVWFSSDKVAWLVIGSRSHSADTSKARAFMDTYHDGTNFVAFIFDYVTNTLLKQTSTDAITWTTLSTVHDFTGEVEKTNYSIINGRSIFIGSRLYLFLRYHGDSAHYVIYSDDNGDTWTMLLRTDGVSNSIIPLFGVNEVFVYDNDKIIVTGGSNAYPYVAFYDFADEFILTPSTILTPDKILVKRIYESGIMSFTCDSAVKHQCIPISWPVDISGFKGGFNVSVYMDEWPPFGGEIKLKLRLGDELDDRGHIDISFGKLYSDCSVCDEMTINSNAAFRASGNNENYGYLDADHLALLLTPIDFQKIMFYRYLEIIAYPSDPITIEFMIHSKVRGFYEGDDE